MPLNDETPVQGCGDGASRGHALFETAIGTCGIAWGPAGILAVQLPERDAQTTCARLLRNLPRAAAHAECKCKGEGGCKGEGDLPRSVRSAITGVQALLAGEPRNLCEVLLDMSRISPFHQQVYAITRAIPPGSTRTYGEVARQIGSPGLARAVGQALGLNPFAPVVPCHRVLAAGDRPGGFSAEGGAATKLHMLQIEGACPGGTLPLF